MHYTFVVGGDAVFELILEHTVRNRIAWFRLAVGALLTLDIWTSIEALGRFAFTIEQFEIIKVHRLQVMVKFSLHSRVMSMHC